VAKRKRKKGAIISREFIIRIDSVKEYGYTPYEPKDREITGSEELYNYEEREDEEKEQEG